MEAERSELVELGNTFSETIVEEDYVEIDEEVAVPQSYWGNFVQDVKNLVVENIDRFFDGREMHCGGPISKKVLHSPPYITRVLNTDISNGVDAAYEAMGFPPQTVDKFNPEQRKQFDKAQMMVSQTLITLSKSGVPKEYAGGVLLMYLEIVKGVDM